MKVKIEFRADTPAFEDSWDFEVGRILDIVKDRLRLGRRPHSSSFLNGPIRDSDGNILGNVMVIGDDQEEQVQDEG